MREEQIDEYLRNKYIIIDSNKVIKKRGESIRLNEIDFDNTQS